MEEKKPSCCQVSRADFMSYGNKEEGQTINKKDYSFDNNMVLLYL